MKRNESPFGSQNDEIKAELGEISGTSAPLFQTVYNCVNEVKRGQTSTSDQDVIEKNPWYIAEWSKKYSHDCCLVCSIQ